MKGSDRDAIVEVVNLYALAVDSQRWPLFERVFTADVDADFGGASRWRDRASFIRDFAAFHAPFDRTQHTMAGHLVVVRGDVAHALTYGAWRLVRHAATGGDLWEGTGWYDDELVRGEAGWRIRRRRCRVVHWTGNPRVQETMPGVRFTLEPVSIRDAAAAGEIGFLDALERGEA